MREFSGLRIAPQLRGRSEAELVRLVADGLAYVQDDTIVPFISGHTALTNNAEGGTNGTTVTTGNSGGTSGTAFDAIVGSPIFSNARPLHGSLAYKIVGNTSGCGMRWIASLGTVTDHWTRIGLNYETYVDTIKVNSSYLVRGLNSTTVSWALRVDDSGVLRLVDVNNATVQAFSTTIALNTAYRIEVHAVEASSVGGNVTVDVWLYAGDAGIGSHLEHQQGVFAGQIQVTEIRWGLPGTTGGLPTYHLDDLAAGGTSQWGPVGGVSVSGTDTGSGSESAAITGIGGRDSGSGTDSASVTSAGGPPSNTAAPVVTGSPTVGRTLTTTDGTWSGTPTSYSYQWQRADDINFTQNVTSVGANQNTYVCVLADVGKYIRCRVTATNAGGSTAANSNTLGLVGRLFSGGLDCDLQVCGNLIGVFTPGSPSFSGAETGHGVDTAAVRVQVTGTEIGTGVDNSVTGTSPVAVSEQGVGTDVASVVQTAIQLSASDSGVGRESAEVTATTPTPTPEPEPLPFLAETEVRVFVCGEMGQKLYAEMEPVTYADAENFNSLHTFLCAIGSQFEEAWQLVRDPIIDGQRIPGWSIIVDLTRTPSKALGWLAQFVGVTLDPSLSDARQRERVHDTDGWKRGSVGAFMAAAKTHLTGDRTVVMHERYTSPYRILVVTRTYETPSPENVLNALIAQKPGGIILEYYVAAGRTYLEVRDENVDYAAAKAAYADYETMRATRLTDVPATDPLIPSETLTPSGTLAPGG